MPGHDGYSRASSQLLSRASRTQTLTGFADAGPTCSPSVSLLCNRDGGSFRSFSIIELAVASGNRELRFIIRSVSEHRPGHPYGLVGQCHGGHVRVAAILELSDPTTQPILLPMGGTHR